MEQVLKFIYILLQPYKPPLIINYPPKCTLLHTSCPLTRVLRETIVRCPTSGACLEQLSGLANAKMLPYARFKVHEDPLSTQTNCLPITTFHIEKQE